MRIDTCRNVQAEDIEVDNELDLDGDEYGDNPDAFSFYAIVQRIKSSYDSKTGEPLVTLHTTQGIFEFPASHCLRVKVDI